MEMQYLLYMTGKSSPKSPMHFGKSILHKVLMFIAFGHDGI